MMIVHGRRTISAGLQRSSSDFGGSFLDARTYASISTTVTLASSEGWPILTLPIASQLFVLAAVPAPFPTTSVNASNATESTYAGIVIHSMNRTDDRLIP